MFLSKQSHPPSHRPHPHTAHTPYPTSHSSHLQNLAMKSYLAAAIQMTSLPDLEKNLAHAEELIELAVHRGAELVSLPENFAFLGTEDDKIDLAQTIATQTEKFLKTSSPKISSHFSRWWVPGTCRD